MPRETAVSSREATTAAPTAAAAPMSSQRAAFILTKLFRRFNTRCIARRRVRGRIAAKIQRWWRRVRLLGPKTVKRQALALRSRWLLDASARSVQAMWRGYLARRPYRAYDARMAAATLQRLGRGFVARWWIGYHPARVAALMTADPDELNTAPSRRNGPVLVPVGYRVAADANEFLLRLQAVKDNTRAKAASLIQRRWREAAGRAVRNAHERLMQGLWNLNDKAMVVQRWWREKLRAMQQQRRIREGNPVHHHSSPRARGGPGSSSGARHTSSDELERARALANVSRALVKHRVESHERRAMREAVQEDLLNVWNDITTPTLATSGGGSNTNRSALTPTPGASVSRNRRLPPLSRSASRADSLVPTQSSVLSDFAHPRLMSNPRSRVSTYKSRMMPEKMVGRYAPYTTPSRNAPVWNQSPLLHAPTWLAEERDPLPPRAHQRRQRASTPFL